MVLTLDLRLFRTTEPSSFEGPEGALAVGTLMIKSRVAVSCRTTADRQSLYSCRAFESSGNWQLLPRVSNVVLFWGVHHEPQRMSQEELR